VATRASSPRADLVAADFLRGRVRPVRCLCVGFRVDFLFVRPAPSCIESFFLSGCHLRRQVPVPGSDSHCWFFSFEYFSPAPSFVLEVFFAPVSVGLSRRCALRLRASVPFRISIFCCLLRRSTPRSHLCLCRPTNLPLLTASQKRISSGLLLVLAVKNC
jgi:hypothetical protein